MEARLEQVLNAASPMLLAVPSIDFSPVQLRNAYWPIVASVSLEMLSESPSLLQL